MASDAIQAAQPWKDFTEPPAPAKPPAYVARINKYIDTYLKTSQGKADINTMIQNTFKPENSQELISTAVANRVNPSNVQDAYLKDLSTTNKTITDAIKDSSADAPVYVSSPGQQAGFSGPNYTLYIALAIAAFFLLKKGKIL